MTYYVSSGTLNPTQSLTHSLLIAEVNFVAVSVVDVYKSSPTTTLRCYDEREPAASLPATYTTEPRSERRPLENGDIERTVGGTGATPPRKRIKRDSPDSQQDDVDIKFADVMTATTHPACTAAVLTPATAATPSLCLAQALPLSGRIIGTVWQQVQSQSATAAAAVSTGNGVLLDF